MVALMFPKPSRTARKLHWWRGRADKRQAERNEKAKVRKRDGGRCRFPLCGCGRFNLRLEVSHDEHKGMGSRDGVSVASRMVLLCAHRHQHGAVSRHQGTLRARYLTAAGYDGPVAWDVDLRALRGLPGASAEWIEVARELSPGRLAVLSERQSGLLRLLADMER